jgi:hypothetical protein
MAIPTGSSHYKEGSVEPLELIEEQALGFHLGNVVKYAVRAQFYARRKKTHRLAEEAADKAIWYLKRFKEIYLWQKPLSSSVEDSTQQ